MSGDTTHRRGWLIPVALSFTGVLLAWGQITVISHLWRTNGPLSLQDGFMLAVVAQIAAALMIAVALVWTLAARRFELSRRVMLWGGIAVLVAVAGLVVAVEAVRLAVQ